MRVNKSYIKLFYIISVLLVMSFSSCSSCSRSGLKKRADERRESNYSNRRTDSRNNNTQSSRTRNDDESSTSNAPIKSNIKVAENLSDLFKLCKPAVFMVYTTDGINYKQGTGFFISSDGYALSNYHVFEGTNQGNEQIQLSNGRKLKIERVIRKDREKDFILFKVESVSNVTYLSIASSPSEIGEQVLAIGNPEGLEHTLSTGIVSGYRENDFYIQTTTEITHGSSGGPLINLKGEAIGITTMGMGTANLNFAINLHKINLSGVSKKKIIEKAQQVKNDFSFLKSMPTSTNGVVIHRNAYTFSYVEKHEQSEWVAYVLKNRNNSTSYSRTNDFREDPLVETETANIFDYEGSVYDRGHLTPAADLDYSYESMSSSFYFSNISPQLPYFNRQTWRKVEKEIREYLFQKDSIYVYTGSIIPRGYQTIGKNNVSVPTAFYKILLGFKNGEVKAIGILMPHNEERMNINRHWVSVDSIEKVSGIDFFSDYRDDIENSLESNSDLKYWRE
jgi:DNA/RNA endonuclease G (NUC1)